MIMVSIAKIADDIAPHMPSVPTIVVQYAAREAVYEFMRDTQCAEATTQFTTQKCVHDYLLDVPDCRRVIAVKSVTIKGSEVRWEMDGINEALVLADGPPDNSCADVIYTWAIGGEDCDVPDAIYDHYKEIIRHKARAIMYAMDEQEWSNFAAYERFTTIYQELVSRVIVRVMRKYSKFDQRYRAASFLGGSGRNRVTSSRRGAGRGFM